MKFMAMVTGIGTPIPPEQGADLVRANKEYVNERLADGTMECCYSFIDGSGFAIFNADSHEEAMDRIMEYPEFPFLIWEVKPLCDANHSFDKWIEFYEKLAG
jgi:muconolactone delta-isomerase